MVAQSGPLVQQLAGGKMIGVVHVFPFRMNKRYLQ
jgi:hypothetical protein